MVNDKVNASKKVVSDATTGRYLPFSQIKDNIIILKDGSSRVVLKCSTINFLLKSTDEQDAIIMSYQRFLNSLSFPIQILVRSKKLDIDTYINKLNKLALEQKNGLLQNQTYQYIEYLQKLIEVAQIMKKEFYIVVPFDYDENKSVRDTTMLGNFMKFWESINQADDIIKIKSQIKSFNKSKKGLATRTNTIKTALKDMQINAKELDKSELVKFLADYYNPSLESFDTMKLKVDEYDLI